MHIRTDYGFDGEEKIRRLAAMDWAQANGLDPKHIPATHHIEVDEVARTITAHVWLVDQDGRPKRSDEDPNTLATEVITVPLVVDVPQVLR
jgi:hypothetical protein